MKHKFQHTDTRFVVQWNFGRSQCGFDDLQSVADFVAKELPKFVEPSPMPRPEKMIDLSS